MVTNIELPGFVVVVDKRDSEENTNNTNNDDKGSCVEECNLQSNFILQLCLIDIQLFSFSQFYFLFR